MGHKSSLATLERMAELAQTLERPEAAELFDELATLKQVQPLLVLRLPSVL